MIKGDSRMSNREDNTATSEHSDSSTPRRPYVKPEFSCEQVFESTALGCVGNPVGGTVT